MRTLPLVLPFVVSLLSAGVAVASERTDAISSVSDAIDAVDADSAACRRAALADLKAADKDLGRGEELKQVTAVAEALRALAKGTKEDCGGAADRAVGRAIRDVDAYVEALRKAAKAAEGPAPMSAKDFAALKAAVAELGASSDKVELIDLALRNNHASVAQLAELAKLVSSDGDRLDLVEKVWRSIVDRKPQGHRIAAAFSASSNGKQAVQVLTQ
jgi:Domain of unknown function (DUF4476)